MTNANAKPAKQLPKKYKCDSCSFGPKDSMVDCRRCPFYGDVKQR